MKLKVIISVFSEDGASVYEVRCAETNKKVDSHYIGETEWIYNREQSLQGQTDFYNKIRNEYDVIKE